MSLTAVLFVLVAAATGAAALGVALSPRIVRSAVCLLAALVGVSLTYFLLGAEFLGAAQLIVYVGGTLVLVVFGVMLTAGGPHATLPATRAEWALGVIVSATLFFGLAVVAFSVPPTAPPADDELPGVAPLGLAFLGVPQEKGGLAYLLPFEIVSVHLLVVLIAAAYLARAKRRKAEAPRG